jgi:hypothetical protein
MLNSLEPTRGPFLDDRDREARLRQDLGGHAAAGAAADHHHVAFELAVRR